MDSADKLGALPCQSVNGLAQSMRTPFKLHPSQVLRVNQNTRSAYQPPLLTSHSAMLTSYSRIAPASATPEATKAAELAKA